MEILKNGETLSANLLIFVQLSMSLNPTVYNKFMQLDGHGKIQGTYAWLGSRAWDIRSKCRTFDKCPSSIKDYPDWNFDVSSTGQASGFDSDVIIKV